MRRAGREACSAFRSVVSVLVRFVVRSFSTNSRPASGRPPAALVRRRPGRSWPGSACSDSRRLHLLHRRSKPQRCSRRLHRLIDYGQQLGRKRIEVDLVTQPGAERLDRLGRVVLAAVEAPVHYRLNAAASRLEQRRHRQGGAGYCPARRISSHPGAEQLPKNQDQAGVDRTKQGGEETINLRRP
jgi:hypothetical protein